MPSDLNFWFWVTLGVCAFVAIAMLVITPIIDWVFDIIFSTDDELKIVDSQRK